MPSPSRHVGPPLLPLALIATGLFLASLIVGAAGGGPFPSPYDPADDILRFFAGHSTTVRVTATLEFAAAVPLAILAAALLAARRTIASTPASKDTQHAHQP
jgi:hypothetical protein